MGKTTLFNEFAKDKDTIFFAALESSVNENLENFSRSILRLRFGRDAASPVFRDFQSALDNVCERARVVLVVDDE